MEWAIDPATGQHVSASQKTALRFRMYECPRCGAQVRLRKGPRRVPHFAHVSGLANPDCEMYVPVFSSGIGLPSGSRGRSYRSLGLYLHVIEGSTRPFSWHLEIGIPEPDIELGSIRVQCAWDGMREFGVRSIGRGGRRVRVRPEAGAYMLMAEGVPESDWVRRVRQPIPGLSLREISIFRFAASGGRRIGEQQPLYWGRTYGLLWTPPMGPNWWPKAELMDVALLQRVDKWCGALIRFPDSHDRQVESWVDQCLGRRIERSLAELTLVSPLPLARLSDGTYVVRPDQEVIVGISGEPGAQGWSHIMLAHPNNDRLSRHKGHGTVPALFSLGSLDIGRTDLWLDGDEEGCLQLFAVSDFQPPLLNLGVELHVQQERGGHGSSIPLHAAGSSNVLRDVRSNQTRLVGIRLPERVLVILRWRQVAQKSDWQSWSPPTEHSYERNELEALTLSKLRELLLSPDLDIEIDAGEFGKARVNARSASDLRMGQRRMTNQWRGRVRWLMSMAHSAPQGGTRSRGLSQVIERGLITCLHPVDQMLVKQLIAYRTWPVDLVPHITAVISECLREIARK